MAAEVVVREHKKRTLQVFVSNQTAPMPEDFESQKAKIMVKILDEYRAVKDLPPPAASKPAATPAPAAAPSSSHSTERKEAPVEVASAHPFPAGPGVFLTADTAATPAAPSESAVERLLKEQQATAKRARGQSELILYAPSINDIAKKAGSADRFAPPGSESRALIQINTPYQSTKPEWHPPWKLMRVISGHLGWVRSVAVDPSNQWFATGSADRTIKIWDLASGQLKLTLTGHISTVRGLVVSDRHPYLFSVSEDKEVKCWDLEVNKVVRHYHGHLSGVYCVAMHPTIDLLLTGGRDAAVRVWDIRSKAQIHCLSGHTNTVASVAAQALDPQVISGSADTTVRLWDIVAGKTIGTLTNHKKSIRALAIHPTEFTFCSGAADNLKHWKLPDAKFIKNFSGHNALVNSLALNRDDVLVSGADNGSLHFWDWRSGYSFQQLDSKPQSGSLESEAGIYAMTFDQTGSRLITCEADKTIKVWREDDTATPESHPIKWNPALVQRRY